jgi:hypothetical protein
MIMLYIKNLLAPCQEVVSENQLICGPVVNGSVLDICTFGFSFQKKGSRTTAYFPFLPAWRRKFANPRLIILIRFISSLHYNPSAPRISDKIPGPPFYQKKPKSGQ